MYLTSRNLQAVTQIYEVVLDTSQWVSVLDELNRQVGSIGCNVFIADHPYAELTALYVSTKLVPALKHYAKYGINKRMEAIIPNLKNIIPDQNLMSLNDLYLENNRRFGTNFYTGDFENWLADNIGITQGFTSPLNYKVAYTDSASFQFGNMPKAQLQKSLSLAKIFLPHLAKAIDLTRPFSLLKARFNAVLSVLDRFHLGVAIFSSSGSIVLSNQAAQIILDRNDGLKLGKQNLIATLDSADDSSLREAFFTATKILDSTLDGQTKLVNIPRRSGASSYIVEVSPLLNREIDLGALFRGVLVIIVDPDDHQIIDVSGLELLFSLTKSEKEICRLLVSGYTTSEMAEIRGTKPDSIRKQINMLLNKTNTSRRSDLVHLAHSINLPVDQPE